MDSIIPDDISYLNFLNDKNQLLLQNGQTDTLGIQESGSLNVEPIFTEFVDGSATWTIGGVPVYLNAPTLNEEVEVEEQQEANAILENGKNVENSESLGFLTSNGVFFPNEVLFQLNLPNAETEKLSKSVELQQKTKKQIDENKNNVNELIEVVSVHKCKICGGLFERYEDIVEHIKAICAEKRNALMFPKVQKMSSILKTDKKPLVKDIYLCGMCENVGYEHLEQLKKHMLTEHKLSCKEAETSLKKPEDEEPINNKAYFQSLVNKQQSDRKKIKCLIKGCDSRFSKPEVMMRHHDCHVNGEKKKFKCPDCDKIFFVWRLCSAHIWKCHKIDIGLFACNVCDTFKSLSAHALLIHMGSHDTARPFLCSSCGKGFKQLTQLRNHQVSVHKETTDLPNWNSRANCTICGKTFASRKLVVKHVQAVHNKFKPFICNICGHQCTRKAMLELHLRQHTGEKPYKCHLCDYKTGDHNSLRRHISRHYGETKYSCPHCEYQCVQSIAFKAHIKKKHPGKEGVFSCQMCPFETVNEQRLYDHSKEQHSVTTGNSVPIQFEMTSVQIESVPSATQKLVPNDDDETQPGIFSDHLEELSTVDTGGITIPAGSEMQV